MIISQCSKQGWDMSREIKFRAWLPKGFFADTELYKMDNRVCVSYDGKLMNLEGDSDE